MSLFNVNVFFSANIIVNTVTKRCKQKTVIYFIFNSVMSAVWRNDFSLRWKYNFGVYIWDWRFTVKKYIFISDYIYIFIIIFIFTYIYNTKSTTFSRCGCLLTGQFKLAMHALCPHSAAGALQQQQQQQQRAETSLIVEQSVNVVSWRHCVLISWSVVCVLRDYLMRVRP